jgi:1-acyl-sn-glycerol-3-phosphate acyltransferase
MIAGADPVAVPVPGQRLIGRLARWVSWLFYRLDRIGSPVRDGAVLLLANHPNSLLDPAIVLATAGRPVRFLAKSTLFKGLLGPLMRFAEAIPVYRRMDAGEDPARNAEMFAAVARALAGGEAVCLFPEGTTHSRARLDPLRTGAARIALSSAASGVAVDIVPVGINLDRKAVFRSRGTVFFGPPFRCDDLLPLYQGEPAAAVRALTERAAERLRSIVIEADPRSAIDAVDRIDSLFSAAGGEPLQAADRMQRRRVIAGAIETLRLRDPAQFESIRVRLQRYDTALARFGLTDTDLRREFRPADVRRFTIRESLYALVLVPVALLGLALFAVPYLITDLVSRRSADLELQATWKVIGGTLIYGAWTVSLSLAAALLRGHVAGVLALVLLPAFGLIALAAIERETDVADSIRAYVAVRSTPGRLKRRLLRRRSELVDLLEETQAGLKGDTSNW